MTGLLDKGRSLVGLVCSMSAPGKFIRADGSTDDGGAASALARWATRSSSGGRSDGGRRWNDRLSRRYRWSLLDESRDHGCGDDLYCNHYVSWHRCGVLALALHTICVPGCLCGGPGGCV